MTARPFFKVQPRKSLVPSTSSSCCCPEILNLEVSQGQPEEVARSLNKVAIKGCGGKQDKQQMEKAVTSRNCGGRSGGASAAVSERQRGQSSCCLAWPHQAHFPASTSVLCSSYEGGKHILLLTRCGPGHSPGSNKFPRFTSQVHLSIP